MRKITLIKDRQDLLAMCLIEVALKLESINDTLQKTIMMLS